MTQGKSETPIVVLDTKGLSRPAPVERAVQAMRGLAPGAILEVHATDPGTVQDFRVLGEAGEAELLKVAEADGVYVVQIRPRS